MCSPVNVSGGFNWTVLPTPQEPMVVSYHLCLYTFGLLFSSHFSENSRKRLMSCVSVQYKLWYTGGLRISVELPHIISEKCFVSVVLCCLFLHDQGEEPRRRRPDDSCWEILNYCVINYFLWTLNMNGSFTYIFIAESYVFLYYKHCDEAKKKVFPHLQKLFIRDYYSLFRSSFFQKSSSGRNVGITM